MAVEFPKGMSDELAARLYRSVKVSWASDAFSFSADRSECQEWLKRGTESMTGDTYDTGHWPYLVEVIRRSRDNKVRVFQFSDGSLFEQTT